VTRPAAIRLTFTECGATARAVLLWEEAPHTCESVVRIMPAEGTAHHAIYSGSECVHLLKSAVQVEKEHATSHVSKGQVGFAWLAARSFYGVENDFAEICWFYDIDAQPRMWEGPVEVNIFAEIREPAVDFYAMCRRMRREGIKRIQIKVDDA
jgi:CheY-like chemotaxis protein